jgi:hypothetical protein
MRLRGVIAVAFLIAALSFFSTSNRTRGAHRAARNSAAFSGLMFALALARRGSTTPATLQTQLTMNFVAAHAMHYACVVAVGVFDVASHLHNMTRGAPIIIAYGTIHLGLIALTARANTRAKAIVNTIAVYALWAIFTLAFSGRGLKGVPLPALMFGLMWLAMAVRIARAVAGRRKQAMVAAGEA